MSTTNSIPTTSKPDLRKRSVKDFKFGKTLGEGAYSTVVEAEELDFEDSTKTLRKFAVKVLSKRFILKENKAKYVNIEKLALSTLRNPLIVKLHYTFQDTTRLFPNGDLLYYIHKRGTFNLELTKFYGGELVQAIAYMHRKGIAHRDLKPENILIDSNFHIKITDFGSSKINGKEGSESKCTGNSFVGTAEYVSPELLQEKDANYGADLWSLGCILFQMLLGKTPFAASNDYQIFKKVVALEYSFEVPVDSNAEDLISKLLVKDPLQRLGAQNFDLLRSHKFFEGLDFDTLHQQTPPNFEVEVPDNEEVDWPGNFHLDQNNVPLV